MRKPGKQAVLSSWRLQPAVTVEDQSTQKGKGSGGRAWALAGSDKAQKGTPGTLEFRAQAWLGLSKGGLDQASSKETESEPGLRAGPRRVRAKLGVGDQDPRGSPRLRGVGGFRASESRAGLAS